MNTVTIPQKIIQQSKDGLVIIDRKEYQEFLVWKNGTKDTKTKKVVKHSKSFVVPKKHEKFYTKIDKELTDALGEVEQGKAIGPLDSAKELESSLES